jgi:hypothetical protein
MAKAILDIAMCNEEDCVDGMALPPQQIVDKLEQIDPEDLDDVIVLLVTTHYPNVQLGG